MTIAMKGVTALIVLMLCADAGVAAPDHFTVRDPGIVLAGVGFDLEIVAMDGSGEVDTSYAGSPEIRGLGGTVTGESFLSGVLVLKKSRIEESGRATVVVSDGDLRGSIELRVIPGLLSIVPPLLAILLALLFRHVVVALVAGVWIGAVFIYDFNPLTGLLRLPDHFVVGAVDDPDHAAIIVFTMLFGGMVGVISKNGGMLGIANRLTVWAKTPRRGQLATWFLGIMIFFDDYANTLIVGNTMRPVTDKLRVSREKLAYIVDATSAPVASLFFISSWIGYEVGLIDSAIKSIGYVQENAYWIFIDSIAFRFYPIFTLILGFAIAATGRDFGAMWSAERRARLTGKLYRDGARLATDLPAMDDDGRVSKWWNGVLPILTVVVVGIIGLYVTGYDAVLDSGGNDFSLSNIVGSSDSYKALQWAALASCLVAIVLTVSQKVMSLDETLGAWIDGMRAMIFAIVILILAWSIGEVTVELKTAEYLVRILEGNLAPHFLPVLTFLVAAIISFATGTSWGTMGIIMPLVIPLSVALSVNAGLDPAGVHLILVGGVSSVLAGAVAGDHCSPISDTTILSSTASSCDHMDHVRTQLPYAILAATVGMLLGDIPTAYGLPPYVSVVAGTAVLIALLYVLGKPVDGPEA